MSGTCCLRIFKTGWRKSSARSGPRWIRRICADNPRYHSGRNSTGKGRQCDMWKKLSRTHEASQFNLITGVEGL